MRTVCFSNDTATTEIYTLSLHDALPISVVAVAVVGDHVGLPADPRHRVDDIGTRPEEARDLVGRVHEGEDRKSTRLNSSHANISYAVFCLKKNNSIAL